MLVCVGGFLGGTSWVPCKTARNRLLADGTQGFFHPDNLSFGKGSPEPLVSAAQAIAGVERHRDKTGTAVRRTGQEIENGLLALGPLEIARGQRSLPGTQAVSSTCEEGDERQPLRLL
jgi:hypothetical protein